MSDFNVIKRRALHPIEQFRRKVFTILIEEKNINSAGRFFNAVIITLILLNIIAVILETVASIYQSYKPYFETLEIYTLTIFTIEYFLQLWICTLNRKYRHPFWGRLKFIFSPMVIIELLVILPFILSLLSDIDLRFLTIFRFIMVLRIFKLEKYSEAMQTFKHVLNDKKEELIITFFTIIMMLIVTSSLMYLVEKDANPAFSSIPATMWWTASTLTTVGYGDVVPLTVLGKILGSLTAILGIAMFAVPAGLISSSFTEYVQLSKKKKSCPHCGKEL